MIQQIKIYDRENRLADEVKADAEIQSTKGWYVHTMEAHHFTSGGDKVVVVYRKGSGPLTY